MASELDDLVGRSGDLEGRAIKVIGITREGDLIVQYVYTSDPKTFTVRRSRVWFTPTRSTP